jgi:hypothetical protein
MGPTCYTCPHPRAGRAAGSVCLGLSFSTASRWPGCADQIRDGYAAPLNPHRPGHHPPRAGLPTPATWRSTVDGRSTPPRVGAHSSPLLPRFGRTALRQSSVPAASPCRLTRPELAPRVGQAVWDKRPPQCTAVPRRSSLPPFLELGPHRRSAGWHRLTLSPSTRPHRVLPCTARETGERDGREAVERWEGKRSGAAPSLEFWWTKRTRNLRIYSSWSCSRHSIKHTVTGRSLIPLPAEKQRIEYES